MEQLSSVWPSIFVCVIGVAFIYKGLIDSRYCAKLVLVENSSLLVAVQRLVADDFIRQTYANLGHSPLAISRPRSNPI
jgi:hypothetical protein